MLILAVPVLVLALCDAGLAYNYLGTTCVNNPPSYGSVKTEWSPVEIRYCTSNPGSNKKCVSGSVMFQKKETLYSDVDCTGYVVSTTGWQNAGTFAYDSLCTCPA
jgi:hypothetical protein